VYVNIGSSVQPTATNRSAAVPPFSSYTADPGGAISFGIFVDHASDLVPVYAYPINIVFSEAASEVEAPLSPALPASISWLYLKRIVEVPQAISGSGDVQWSHTQRAYNGTISFSNTTLTINQAHVWNAAVNMSFSSLSGITQINVSLRVNPGGQVLFTASDFLAASQTTSSISFNKIIPVPASGSVFVTVTLFGTTPSLTVDPTSTMTLTLLS
jgi:hypothetical protein